jgi:hypothetical protein
MSEVFQQLLEVVGSSSAVHSVKRTVEVVPEKLILEDVRGVPLQTGAEVTNSFSFQKAEV